MGDRYTCAITRILIPEGEEIVWIPTINQFEETKICGITFTGKIGERGVLEFEETAFSKEFCKWHKVKDINSFIEIGKFKLYDPISPVVKILKKTGIGNITGKIIKISNKTLRVKGVVCFKSAWDKMVELGNDGNAFLNTQLTKEFLEESGYVFIKEDKRRERYKYKYVKNNEILWSDGNYIEGEVYSPLDLKNLTESGKEMLKTLPSKYFFVKKALTTNEFYQNNIFIRSDDPTAEIYKNMKEVTTLYTEIANTMAGAKAFIECNIKLENIDSYSPTGEMQIKLAEFVLNQTKKYNNKYV